MARAVADAAQLTLFELIKRGDRAKVMLRETILRHQILARETRELRRSIDQQHQPSLREARA